MVQLLRDVYNKCQHPISFSDIQNFSKTPTYTVFTKYGGWKHLCEEYNILYIDRKKVKTTSKNKGVTRVGEERKDKNGCITKIVKYNNANDIIIQFQDEYKAKLHTTYRNWIMNNYFNPYDKRIFNKGCIGNAVSKINGIKKDSYKVWYAMLQRCYSECYKSKPTYVECFVCKEWLVYENFEKWYNNNIYVVNNEQMMLDKDILYKGNKIYDEKHCVFVPQSINKLFTKRQLHRGKCPIGVIFDKRNDTYIAQCNADNKRVYLGTYSNPNDAFAEYKKFKENQIKIVADRYKNQIPNKLYKAMYEYKVDIIN